MLEHFVTFQTTFKGAVLIFFSRRALYNNIGNYPILKKIYKVYGFFSLLNNSFQLNKSYLKILRESDG